MCGHGEPHRDPGPTPIAIERKRTEHNAARTSPNRYIRKRGGAHYSLPNSNFTTFNRFDLAAVSLTEVGRESDAYLNLHVTNTAWPHSDSARYW
jgi:hypothetical protein